MSVRSDLANLRKRLSGRTGIMAGFHLVSAVANDGPAIAALVLKGYRKLARHKNPSIRLSALNALRDLTGVSQLLTLGVKMSMDDPTESEDAGDAQEATRRKSIVARYKK